jgi:hypothetical protein
MTADALFDHSTAGARAVAAAIAEVFPWARHLSVNEQAEFAAELTGALSDAAELGIDVTAREVIAGWRATARIKADNSQYAQALAPTESDYGPVRTAVTATDDPWND